MQESWKSANGQVDPVLYSFYTNLIGVQPYFDTNSSLYRSFASAYRSYPYDRRLATVNGTSPQLRSALSYDATMAMAYALHDMVERQQVADPVAQSVKVIAALKLVNFTGVTGVWVSE